MTAFGSVRVLGLAWLAAWREAWAIRGGFWVQVAAMAANNAVWVVFWVLFFRRVGTIHGWSIDQLVLLMAIVTTSAGVVLGLFANSHQLGQQVASGGLDAALALPVPTLPYVLCRRVNAVHVGDLLFGPVLFVVLGSPTPTRAAAFVFGVVSSALVIAGFLVLVGSLSFVVGRTEASDLGSQMLILFAMYPVDVFPGFARLLLYVVIPAGFVSAVPVRLIDRFDPLWAAGSVAVGLVFIALGWRAFAAGLRRYTSGALWTDA